MLTGYLANKGVRAGEKRVAGVLQDLHQPYHEERCNVSISVTVETQLVFQPKGAARLYTVCVTKMIETSYAQRQTVCTYHPYTFVLPFTEGVKVCYIA